jgi:hypothetical protein
MAVEPSPQPGTLQDIAPLYTKDATLQFKNGNCREEEGGRIFSPDPGHDICVGFAVADLAQFQDDIGIQQIGQDRSTVREKISTRSGDKSMSESPGMDRASNKLMTLAGKTVEVVIGHQHVRRPAPIRDDHRSTLGGFLSAADIVIEFTACEGRHGTVRRSIPFALSSSCPRTCTSVSWIG